MKIKIRLNYPIPDRPNTVRFRKKRFEEEDIGHLVIEDNEYTMRLWMLNEYCSTDSPYERVKLALKVIETFNEIKDYDETITFEMFARICEEERELHDLQWFNYLMIEEIENKAVWAQETCEDCGSIPKDLPWYIADAIDWERVADSLLADYTYVKMDNGNILAWRE